MRSTPPTGEWAKRRAIYQFFGVKNRDFDDNSLLFVQNGDKIGRFEAVKGYRRRPSELVFCVVFLQALCLFEGDRDHAAMLWRDEIADLHHALVEAAEMWPGRSE